MEFLLKFMTIAMVIFLIAVQLVHLTPYGDAIRPDSLNGEPMESYQSIITRGTVTLNLLGEYIANSASLFVNGRHVMVIDRFPVKLELESGDVVEIQAEKQTPDFYVYLSDKSSQLYTDMKTSPAKVTPGMNRIMKVNIGKR